MVNSEKAQTEVRVNSARDDGSDTKSESDHDAPYWQPGYMRRLPILGLLSLLLVLCCTLASVAVLVVSNNKSSSQWTLRFAPNVVLSGLNAVANLALIVAVGQGSSIAWWRKAMHGATVAELHRSWNHSSSFYEVLKNIFRLDRIGLAALAAKIAVIDGILYQRATTTYVGQDPAVNISMMGAASTVFPQTGYVVSDGYGAQSNCECFMVGDAFTPVVNNWETSNGFFKGYNKLFQVCDGTCFAAIDAIGFEIDCTKHKDQTNYAEAAVQAYRAANGSKSANSSAWSNLPIFNSSFTLTFANESRNYSTIDLALQYFQSEDPYNPSSATCPGTLSTIKCSLRPAVVTYPITITNYTNERIINGVSLGIFTRDHRPDPDEILNEPQTLAPYSYSTKQAEGFTVGKYLYPNESRTLFTATYLGGIANALSQFLTSSASITLTGAEVWGLTQRGTLAQTMMYGPPNMGSCDCSFRDEALDTIVNQVNQLAFLTATGLIDTSTFSFPKIKKPSSLSGLAAGVSLPITVNASTALTVVGINSNLTTNFHSLGGTEQVRDVVHYHTEYVYMGVSVALTFVCVLMILPIYWKYGELGRDVTLGPIEIAGAFRAPILSTSTRTTKPGPNDDTHGEPSMQAASSPGPIAPAIAFANVDELLQEVGDRKVMYGFVDVEDERKPETGADNALLSPTTSTFKRRSVLGFQDSLNTKVRPASGIYSSPPSSPRF